MSLNHIEHMIEWTSLEPQMIEAVGSEAKGAFFCWLEDRYGYGTCLHNGTMFTHLFEDETPFDDTDHRWGSAEWPELDTPLKQAYWWLYTIAPSDLKIRYSW